MDERSPAAVRQRLFALGEEGNAAFVAKLIPNIPAETVLGVRTPALRRLAKELARSGEAVSFLDTLPHAYFEENNLHAFLLCEQKEFDRCIAGVERFLPYVDNWATCDGLTPPVFRKHREDLLPRVYSWLESELPYTRRFAVKMLMDHFLDEAFSSEYPEMVSVILSEEYYVNMMRAWYFATALAKQWDSALPFLEQGRLDRWTHNKTIQKAVESYRIPEERKQILRSLRRGKISVKD